MNKIQSIRNESGELSASVDGLLAMAGYGPKAEQYLHEGNLVWIKGLGGQFCADRIGDPFMMTEVRREAHRVIAKARGWIHENLRGFKRSVKLTEWEAVQLWKVSTHEKFEIVRCKVGETVEIPRQGGSYFGSGGGWGRWEVFGEVTEEVTDTDDNGFMVENTMKITFDKGPAAVYTAAGDGINGGRVFYRRLYVAE